MSQNQISEELIQGILARHRILYVESLFPFLSPFYFRIIQASSPSHPSNSLNTPSTPPSQPSSLNRKEELYNLHSSSIQRKICRQGTFRRPLGMERSGSNLILVHNALHTSKKHSAKPMIHRASFLNVHLALFLLYA